VGWDLFLQLRGQLFLMQDEPGAKEAVAAAAKEANLQRISHQQQLFSHHDIGKGDGKQTDNGETSESKVGANAALAPPLFRRSSSRLSRVSGGPTRHPSHGEASRGDVSDKDRDGGASLKRWSSSSAAMGPQGGEDAREQTTALEALPLSHRQIPAETKEPLGVDHPPRGSGAPDEPQILRPVQSSPTRAAAGLGRGAGCGASEDGSGDVAGMADVGPSSVGSLSDGPFASAAFVAMGIHGFSPEWYEPA
jgi:hypothetical protein